MFSGLKLAKDEPPVASVYLTKARLRQSLRLIMAKPDGTMAEATDTELAECQQPDGTWKPEALEACGCLNRSALSAFLVACGVSRFHPEVQRQLELGFATLLGFLRALMTGGFGRVECSLPKLRRRLSEAAFEAAERAYEWLVKFGRAYPEMPVRLGLAAGVDVFCAVLLELLAPAGSADDDDATT